MADQTGAQPVGDGPFLTDVKTLRERARKHIEDGAVTEGYKVNRETAVKILNEALQQKLCACCVIDVITSWLQAFTRKVWPPSFCNTQTRNRHTRTKLRPGLSS